MRKRGEISMEVIIIAAVALLVLVILSVLLIRSGVLFGQGTSCEGTGGVCDSDCSGYTDDQGRLYVSSGQGTCSEGSVCCIPLGKGSS